MGKVTFASGHRKRGNGLWIFTSPGGLKLQHNGRWSDARRRAERWASEIEADTLDVMNLERPPRGVVNNAGISHRRRSLVPPVMVMVMDDENENKGQQEQEQ